MFHKTGRYPETLLCAERRRPWQEGSIISLSGLKKEPSSGGWLDVAGNMMCTSQHTFAMQMDSFSQSFYRLG